MSSYIIIPKPEDENKPKPKVPIISRIGESNVCLNCGEKPKFTFRFGKGVEEVKVKLCRECTEDYKKKLDREFGNTFWGTLDKYVKAKKQPRTIPVTYYK